MVQSTASLGEDRQTKCPGREMRSIVPAAAVDPCEPTHQNHREALKRHGDRRERQRDRRTEAEMATASGAEDHRNGPTKAMGKLVDLAAVSADRRDYLRSFRTAPR